jgi:phytoene dehydrogenase-like protein
MGAITQAMASVARSTGVKIRTDAAVNRIVVAKGKARGVRLESCETYSEKAILSNADHNRTFL